MTAEIGRKASGKGGAVAAGKPVSVEAGIRLLEQNGNACDAAVATLLVLSVTDYGLFAIGGEVPLLIYDAKSKEVKVLCGLGSAPLDSKAIKWYYDHGIPSRGSMKAAPTPGMIHLCFTALSLYGTKSFEDTVQPTLEILDAGKKTWYKPLAVTLRKLVETERKTKGSRKIKLAAARDRFYKGDIADELEAWYIASGSFLRKRDLAEHTTRVETPVSIKYRGYTVYKCPTWTQGPYLCQSLRILEGYDLKQMGHLQADYVHVVTEALKLGFADRDKYYGDPLFVDVPLKQLLSDSYTLERRSLIDLKRASLTRRPGKPDESLPKKSDRNPSDQLKKSKSKIPVRDTTTCLVADRWGNVVAATPSCNVLRNQPGPSGITQGNRLRSLNTNRTHPNRIEAGKRPRITLTPTIVTKNGKPVLAISVAGGDLQDQTTLNLFLNHVEFGMLPDKAVTAPRFQTMHHQNSFDPNSDRRRAFGKVGGLQVHSGVSKKVRDELKRRGHKLSTTPRGIAHPVMIYIDPNSGEIHAAGDPTPIGIANDKGRHVGAIK